MAGDTTITVVGNLTDDPEIKVTPSGTSVAKFRVASTPREFDKTSQQWRDGQPLFMSCVAWREMADNVAQSLTRGSRVIVQGRLTQRSYETREGEKRTVLELQVDEVGPSLKYATAKVQKMQRTGGNSGFGGGSNGGQRAAADDPWATGGAKSGGSFDDEPPF